MSGDSVSPNCARCRGALPEKEIEYMVFGCKPEGWTSTRGCEEGWVEDIVLQFCSPRCALTYCASRCPCGGTCWKDFDLESLRAKPRGAWVAA